MEENTYTEYAPDETKEKKEDKKSNSKSIFSKFKIYLAFLIIGAVMGTLGLKILSRTFSTRKSAPVVTANVIVEQLQEVQDLVSMEYHYKNVGAYDDAGASLGILTIPFTGKKALVTYQGVLKAGIDVSLLNPQVDEESHLITLTLPEAKIIAHDVDQNSMEIYDESASIFRPFKMSDFNEFMKQEKERVLQDAIASGVLEQAREKAARTVEGLLKKMSVTEEYKIGWSSEVPDAETQE